MYAELLLSMQGGVPDRVHVITPLAQESYRTAEFAAYYRLARARLQAAVIATPPPSTYPNPMAHCDICSYWHHCDRHRRADDHPSLTAAIRNAQVREFQQQGLPTVAVIAQREGRLPAKPTRGAAETYQRARHATRGAELDQLLRGRRFVDLHAVVREAFRIGVERYGLKELETLHGFQRRLDLREASVARRDLELALELGGGDAIGDETRQRVAAYNADDCLSTESLRGWLERQRAAVLARGESVVRPVPGELTPSEEVSARDRRIEALRHELLQGLASDLEARTADENARALLAAMLGYYRQEGKNAWWEFFRLRDLPNDEHLDEREMLGGLEFVERLAKQGRERNARCRFRFPAQETAVDVGDGVVWPVFASPSQEPETSKAKVEELNLIERTVVLSVSEKAMHSLPSAVFRDPVVSAKALEEALLAFAEHVRDNGFEDASPYAAASELLRARPPRRAIGTGEALRRADEDAGQSLVRLCRELDGGVLPVQGPPGAGKTTLGAQVILALAAAGKKVGITAVSHKVIDNFLLAVRKADNSASQPQRIHLVHKDDGREDATGIEFAKSTGDALARVAPGTIVGGTAWLWAHPDAVGCLDVLFVDEAGQMSLAQVLAAARAARNLVLLGDPQQLEQPTRGAHEDGADVAALMHLLGSAQATLRAEQGLFLDQTYRLHPAVCTFTSEAYYEGRLLSAPNLERQCVGGTTSFAGSGVFLVEVAHQGNQAHASEEVDAVVAIARSLLQSDTTWTNAEGQTRALGSNDILVVAPYNAQVSALRRALAQMHVTRVGTVDMFQGQEAPVVIYSCTSSSPEDAPRGMAFLYDPHRFNVATSRARGSVIVVASPQLFEPNCRTPAQMRWANGFCRFAEMAVRVPLP